MRREEGERAPQGSEGLWVSWQREDVSGNYLLFESDLRVS